MRWNHDKSGIHRKTFRTCLALVLGVAPAAAGSYTITDLGTLGGDVSTAFGLNAAGQVVGQSTVAIGQENIHAFVFDGTQMHDLGALGGDPHSIGFAINAAGQIVGPSFTLGELTSHAARWDNLSPTSLGDFLPRDINDHGTVVGHANVQIAGLGYVHRAAVYDGTLTLLGTLGGDSSEAYAINNAGWIVGAASPNADDPPHAFVAIGGVLHDLGTLGGAMSLACDINDQGQAVGLSRTAGGQLHAVLFELDAAGNVTARIDLGELGGGYSRAAAVNNAGQVVGTSDDRAFLWTAGDGMIDLNTRLPAGSGWQLVRANGINDAGQIVGQGWIGGHLHAFLLTPSTGTTCTGDLNADGTIDTADLAILLAHFGAAAAPDQGDLDGNGTVDLTDLATLLTVFGTNCP